MFVENIVRGDRRFEVINQIPGQTVRGPILFDVDPNEVYQIYKFIPERPLQIGRDYQVMIRFQKNGYLMYRWTFQTSSS